MWGGFLIFCGKSVGGNLGALKDSSLPLPERVDVPAAFLRGWRELPVCMSELLDRNRDGNGLGIGREQLIKRVVASS